MFMVCPLLWKSKILTQIALSTMETEYIALSNAMCDLIAICGAVKEIGLYVFPNSLKNKLNNFPTSTTAKTFGQVP